MRDAVPRIEKALKAAGFYDDEPAAFFDCGAEDSYSGFIVYVRKRKSCLAEGKQPFFGLL